MYIFPKIHDAQHNPQNSVTLQNISGCVYINFGCTVDCPNANQTCDLYSCNSLTLILSYYTHYRKFNFISADLDRRILSSHDDHIQMCISLAAVKK